MPRPLRVHVEGALYYVTSQAIAPFVLFKDARDYETYLELLAATGEHSDVHERLFGSGRGGSGRFFYRSVGL